MDSVEDKARKVFGERAATYVTSVVHKDPEILARVVALAQAQADWRALDVATGTGHTALALAPHVREVVGIDLTPEMLAEAERLRVAKGATNVRWEVGDVHALGFADGSFDLVVSRRAPHHFSDIAGALGEMRRVLRPAGRLVIDDRSVPEDDFIDATMNRLDWLHDESHVRQYRPSEWRRLLDAAGFAVEEAHPYTSRRPLSVLTAGVSEENVREIDRIIGALDERQRALFGLEEVDGAMHSTHWYVMIAATRA